MTTPFNIVSIKNYKVICNDCMKYGGEKVEDA